MSTNPQAPSDTHSEVAMDFIQNFYSNKASSDYEKILDMIETGPEDMTRQDFTRELGIDDKVLDAFFDIAIRGCDENKRDTICDRLILINKDKLGEIAKRLKYENIRLQNDKSSFDRRISELQDLVSQKDEQLHELQGAIKTNDFAEDDSALREEITELQNERVELMVQIDNLKNSLEYIQIENNELKQNIENLASEKSEIQYVIEGLNNDAAVKDQTIENLQEQINYSDNATYGNAAVDPEELSRLQYEVGSITSERDSLLEQIQSYASSESFGSSNTVDDSQLEELNSRIYELESELHTKEYIISEMSETISRLQSDLEEKKHASSGQNSAADVDHIETESKSLEEIELFDDVNDEPIAKKKSKKGLYIIVGILFTVLLALIFMVILNQSSGGPVTGEPTPLLPSEKITGEGLDTNVANGAVTQLPPNPTTVPINSAEVQGAVPTALGAPVAAPAQPTGIIQALTTPYDFRKNSKSFKITEQGVVVDGQTFKTGEEINGFKLLTIQKTFIRFLDTKNDLEFRVDVGV